MQPEQVKPQTDAEKLVWSHAYWARLNHESEKFTPTVARDAANQILGHAREMGLVDIMAAELSPTAKELLK
jgi:hypothetical protein